MCRRWQLHVRISAGKLVQERSHIGRSLASRLLVNEQHRSRSTLGRRHHPTHSAGGTVRLPTRPTLNVIVDLVTPVNGDPPLVTPFVVVGAGRFQTRESFLDNETFTARR